MYIYVYGCTYVTLGRPAGERLPFEPGLHEAARARRRVALARTLAADIYMYMCI